MRIPFINPFKDQIAAKPQVRVVRAEPEQGITTEQQILHDFYFTIRLCELYLRNSRETGRDFVPRALAITQCLYGDGRELTLPVAVGEQLFAQLDSQANFGNGEHAVTFHDCNLAGPLPYQGGDIGFFSGLYRVESGNFADSVFNLVADIGGSLGMDLSKYLEIGQQVTSRLPALLGLDTGNLRIGYYSPLYQEGDDYFDRYLILLGQGSGPVDIDSIEIDEHESHTTLRLKRGNEYSPFNLCDYALIKLGARGSRSDIARFCFHKRFNRIKSLILGNEPEKAEWEKIELTQEVANCPDLTNQQQHTLIAMYRAKIDQWSQLAKTKGASRGGHARNQPQDELATGVAIGAARSAKLAENTVATLANYAREWEHFSRLIGDPDEDEFSEETMDAFLKTMRDKKIALTPASELAEALAIHQFSRH